MLEEKSRSPAAVQVTSEVKQLRIELEKERDKLAIIQSKLQGTFLLSEGPEMILNNLLFEMSYFLFPSSEEQKLNESFHAELKSLKLDRDKVSFEIVLLFS